MESTTILPWAKPGRRRVDVPRKTQPVVADARGEPKRFEHLPLVIGVKVQPLQVGPETLDNISPAQTGIDRIKHMVRRVGGARLVSSADDQCVGGCLPDLLKFSRVGDQFISAVHLERVQLHVAARPDENERGPGIRESERIFKPSRQE